MKKILFLSIFFIIGNKSYSQNLEYSRVIDTSLTITIPSGYCFNTGNNGFFGNYLSVPQGKVWKVQSVDIIVPTPSYHYISYGSNTCGFYCFDTKVTLTKKTSTTENHIYLQAIGNSAGSPPSSASNIYNSPIWLDDTQLGIGIWHSNSPYSYCSTQSYNAHIHFSIIEFNE